MVGFTPEYDPDSPSAPIRNNSISVLSPSFIFSENVRARRRNMLASLFISICVLTLNSFEPNLQLRSFLIMRLEEPLSSLTPVLWLLSGHLLFATISFLVELFSEMKKRSVGFHRIGLQFSGANREDGFGVKKGYYFQATQLKLSAIEPNAWKNLENEGRLIIQLEHNPALPISRLFLHDLAFIGRKVLTVIELEKKIGVDSKQLSSRELSDIELSTCDLDVIRRMRQKCAHEVILAFKWHTYRKFVWWYEVFVPLILSFTFIALMIFV